MFNITLILFCLLPFNREDIDNKLLGTEKIDVKSTEIEKNILLLYTPEKNNVVAMFFGFEGYPQAGDFISERQVRPDYVTAEFTEDEENFYFIISTGNGWSYDSWGDWKLINSDDQIKIPIKKPIRCQLP